MGEIAVPTDLVPDNDASHRSMHLKDLETGQDTDEDVAHHDAKTEINHDELEEIDLSSPRRSRSERDKTRRDTAPQIDNADGAGAWDEVMNRMEEGRSQESSQCDWKPVTHVMAFFLGLLLVPFSLVITASLYVFPCIPERWRQNSHTSRATVGAILGAIAMGIFIVVMQGIKTFETP